MTRKGLLYTLAAYILWGLSPLFWKALQHVNASEIVAHRVVWSIPILLLFVVLSRQWEYILPAIKSPKILRYLFACAALITINWGVYIYAIASGQLVEASMGYFIGPLVMVILGRFFLNERLNRYQLIAVMLATFSVVYLVFQAGTYPYIALVLAITFSIYNLLRKKVAVKSITGLSIEVLLISPFAICFLIWLSQRQELTYGHQSFATDALLMLCGLITTLPLIWAISGARELSMTLIGFLQYTNPTLQFIVAVTVFKEPLDMQELTAFIMIWLAIAIFLYDSFRTSRMHEQGLKPI